MHRGDRRRRRGPGGRRASPTPTPRCRVGEWRRCGRPGVEVTIGVAADEVTEQLAPYLKHRQHRSPLGGAQDGGHPRRPAPRRPTARAAGSPARRRGATPTGCGRAPTPCWSARAPCGPTTPQLTVAARRRRRTAPAPAGGARHGADRGPGCTRRSSSPATWATCSTSWGAAACSRCWSRAEPRWPTTSTPRAWSTATCCTWRRRCFGGDDGRPLFAGPGPAQLATCGGDGWCRSSAWASDLRVEVAA